jgi:hypothetical protein
VREVENIPGDGVVPAPKPELDRVLSWLVSRYFVPVRTTENAAWLVGFLERCSARRDDLGPEFFDVVSEPQKPSPLFELLESSRLRARLQNGDLSRWSQGPGPFASGAGAPDGFEFIDRGGSATLSRSSVDRVSALRLERTRQGSAPTLLLQRIFDLSLSAGALARLSFRVRGTPGRELGTYLYLQVADGESGFGTPLTRVPLSADWQKFSQVVAIPELGERRPGAGNHLELVFVLAPEAGAATFELSSLEFEPVS